MFSLPAALSLWLLLSGAPDLEQALARFTGVFALVEEHASEPLNFEQAFYQGAIPGMLRRLDPHSVFFDPAQFEQLQEMQTSTRKGFGSVVSVLPGRVIVLQTLPGTPSARSGMAPGDEILAVNGYRLDRLEMEQLIALLGAARRETARVEVKRPGEPSMLQFVLAPEEMQSPSVERAFFLAAGIGYVRVASFEEKTGAQLREAIEKLGGGKLKGLVLDLRNNPGGLLPAALETASLFLKPGQTVLKVRGRAVAEREEKAPENFHPYSFPLAVLINGRSASASEIVAGALQDHGRAAIVGEPSFGKGLVESVYPLSAGAGLALTTAFYYTPSGRSIQRPLDRAQFALAAKVTAERGGILPGHVAYPEPVSRLRAVLEASGSFPEFAAEYLRTHKAGPDFEVTPEVLDDFQLFLSERRIRPGVGEWSSERDFMRNRLKTEIFNQALGVEKGDEIEAERDPQVRKALDVLQ
ncbi:MAG: PDZ domain-containing protein [Acidobacteria bacterium]|nr:PDZ domain-containing protein [Acidobacteriota bacterium]